jgi:hypothetical protein
MPEACVPHDAMEDVLDVCKRPHDPTRPLVCLDETSKQLVEETRTPQPMQSGQPSRHDYEFTRNGLRNMFMLFAPLEGIRHVEVVMPEACGARRSARPSTMHAC